MIESCKIVKKCRITEKANALSSGTNCYTFEVSSGVSCFSIKTAIENAFKVKVKHVCGLNRKLKVKRSRMRRVQPGTVGGMKKAMVTLVSGYKIDMA